MFFKPLIFVLYSYFMFLKICFLFLSKLIRKKYMPRLRYSFGLKRKFFTVKIKIIQKQNFIEFLSKVIFQE